MPHTYTNGIVTFYEDAGDGPVVVLIHGYAGDLGTWDYQVQPLVAAGFRVVRYDLRGHGRSMIAPNGYTWEERAADLNDLLARLNVERPATESLSVEAAHVVGISMGGGIALQFALQYPAQTLSLTFVDAVLPGLMLGGETTRRFGELVQAVHSEGARAAFDRVWLGHPFFDGVRRFPDRFKQLREAVIAYEAPEMREGATPPDYHADLTPRLAEIEAPALVVVGENDDLAFHQIAGMLVDGLPRARQVVLPDCWHMAPIEKPEEFNETLIGFLKEISI